MGVANRWGSKKINIPRRLRRRSFRRPKWCLWMGVAYSLGRRGYTESWIKMMGFVQITSFVKFGFFFILILNMVHVPHRLIHQKRPETRHEVHWYSEEKVRKSEISQFCAKMMKNTTTPFERIQCTASFPRRQCFE